MQVEGGWRCQRDASHTRQRGPGRGCYECHVIANRARAQRDRDLNKRIARIVLDSDATFQDIKITPAASAYLAAFDEYLNATRTGIPSTIAGAERAKAMALERLTEHGAS